MSLNIASLPRVNRTLPFPIMRTDKLTTLSLAGCGTLTAAEMDAVCMHTALTDLDVSGCRSINFQTLSCLAQLQRLIAKGCNVADEDLQHLRSVRHLTDLDISGSAVTTLQGIRHMHLLRSLDLSNCVGLTDDGLRPLSQLPLLMTLSLKGCSNITEAGIVGLPSTMTSINLVGCPLIDASSITFFVTR
jgi:hypothetical protein